MKIYEVKIKKGFNDFTSKKVAAPNIEKALEFAKRYAKKNYYSSAEIQIVELLMDVDIFYKS